MLRDNIPKVGIVILNWNNFKATNRCILSLKKIYYERYKIYLVDNGSKDNSGIKLKKKFKKIKNLVFVFNNENLGFAAGCNRGVKKAFGDNCKYVLLLNNDCIIYDNKFLNYAVELAEQTPKCGIVGGKINFWPNTKQIWSTGGYIKFFGGEKHIGNREADVGQYEKVEEREFISGALMLIKNDLFKKIGLLPEVYFFGKEEWEYSTRARKSGFKLFYCPNFKVYHEASNSHSWSDPTYIYNGTLSKILYKRRNHQKHIFDIWLGLYSSYLKVIFPIIYYLKRKQYQKGIERDAIRFAMLKALADSRKIFKITNQMLSEYRRKYVLLDGK